MSYVLVKRIEDCVTLLSACLFDSRADAVLALAEMLEDPDSRDESAEYSIMDVDDMTPVILLPVESPAENAAGDAHREDDEISSTEEAEEQEAAVDEDSAVDPLAEAAATVPAVEADPYGSDAEEEVLEQAPADDAHTQETALATVDKVTDDPLLSADLEEDAAPEAGVEPDAEGVQTPDSDSELPVVEEPTAAEQTVEELLFAAHGESEPDLTGPSGDSLASPTAPDETVEALADDAQCVSAESESEPMMPGYEAGGSDLDLFTCDDCVYAATCPNKGERLPSACGSFQWVTV